MIVLITMFSFFIDGLLSYYIPLNSLFLPLFTIVSLIIIYPYFNNNNYRYFKFLFLIGILYDITYANTIFFNSFIFLILGFIIGLLNYLMANNVYTNILITIISIMTYRFLTFLSVFLFKNSHYTFINLFESIYRSLILNIIYCVVIYSITEYYSNKKRIMRCK